MFGELSPQEVIQFVDFDSLPLAILIVLLGALTAEGITRAFENLGERFSDRRLLFKKIGVLVRFGLSQYMNSPIYWGPDGKPPPDTTGMDKGP